MERDNTGKICGHEIGMDALRMRDDTETTLEEESMPTRKIVSMALCFQTWRELAPLS